MYKDTEDKLKSTLARNNVLELLFNMELSCKDLEWLVEGIQEEIACRMEE